MGDFFDRFQAIFWIVFGHFASEWKNIFLCDLHPKITNKNSLIVEIIKR